MALQLTGHTMPRVIETAKLVRQDRSAAFHAMTETKNQLAKARLVVLLAALVVTQVTVLIASVLVGLAGTSVPRVPFALFAFPTFVLRRRGKGVQRRGEEWSSTPVTRPASHHLRWAALIEAMVCLVACAAASRTAFQNLNDLFDCKRPDCLTVAIAKS